MKKYKLLIIMLILFLPITIFADYDIEVQDVYDYKEFFDDLYPVEEEAEQSDYTDACGGSKYFWPIGSDEITKENGIEKAIGTPNTIYISSYFGSTEAGIHDNGHGALDIAPSADAGVVNVIAAQSGEVVYANTGCVSFEGLGSSCGGGYGNYVVIKSNDGNYEYYAHMHQNTVKVNVGDKVVQGQIIGKVGSSGRSTGTHLHFEMREGEDSREARVDPLNYVDPNNPRPTGGESCEMPQEFVDMIRATEGGYTDGDYYIAYDGGDGPEWTIGPGLTPYAEDSFTEAGIDINSIHVGSRVEKSKIDKVFSIDLRKRKERVAKMLSENGINLNNNQLLAITSGDYNGGQGFTNNYIDHYKEVGNTYKVYQAFCEYVHGNGITYPGLIKRRKVEWLIYTDNIYTTIDNQSADNNVECIGNFSVPSDKKDSLSSMIKDTSKGFNGSISYH